MGRVDPTRNAAALEEWIAGKAGASRARIEGCSRLSGGAIQDNFLLRLDVADGPCAGLREAVLRTNAPSGVPDSRSRGEEFALLRAARTAGVTVPEPLWLCQDEAVLGQAFYLMRRVRGLALGRRIVSDPRVGGDRVRLAGRLGRELARIHAIRPGGALAAGLGFLGAPPEQPALDLIGRCRAWLDRHPLPYPGLEWGLRWAERQARAPGEIVLVHNDFRTGNYLVDEEGLAAVLDWEFAGWGDPMADIGWFCARCWRFGSPLEAGGVAARDPFYCAYEAESGRRIDGDAVRYWEVLAHLRWAVTALQQAQRHISGREPSLDLALTGRRAAELEWQVLAMTAPEAA